MNDTLDLQTIADQLFAELNSNKAQYRYLLLDMLGTASELSHIYYEALYDELDSSQLAVIKRPRLAHNPLSCPHLVCIGEPDKPLDEDRFLASILQIKEDFLTSKYYICGWITSPLPANELAEYLLNAGKQAGAQLAPPFFPFYEPFRFDVLKHSMGEGNSLGLLFPAETHYYFVDTDGTVQAIEGNDKNSEEDYQSHFLNSTLHYYQNNLNMLYGLLLSWQNICEKMATVPEKGILSDIMKYLYKTDKAGLSRDNDKKAYVLFSLRYGDIERSDKLAKIIQDVAENKPGRLGIMIKDETEEFKALKSNH